MSRQLDQVWEERRKREDAATLHAIGGGLSSALERSGVIMSGFSMRCDRGDCLVTLKGVLAGRSQISFVGGEDLGACLRKAVVGAKNDKLTWRRDKYAKREV